MLFSGRFFVLLGFMAACMCVSAQAAETPKPLHALAMHGAPKYAADFQHFDYVNPEAPKGGEMRLAQLGTFDSLNSFIMKGQVAPGIGLIYQTLLTNSDDEAFSEYGQIAESLEVPDDRSWVVFNLRKNAVWQDGKPLTADDVVWTFQTLMQKGHPFYQAYYANVKEAVAENAHRVKFIFNMAGNRELPLVMGQMSVLPKHYWEGKDFSATTLEPPLGSGPYKVKSVDQGKRIVYERVKDWWAADLPVNKGRYNFDTIVYDTYRDETVLLQAFFAGEYDVRQENIAKAWAQEYDQAPVRDGLIKKEEISHEQPVGMQAFAFNIRRPVFQDARVREAINNAFDFEWGNKQFAFGAYKRTRSYFENSELASRGLPTGRELEILETYRGKVPEAVFTTEFKVPETDGSGQGIRKNLSRARELLKQAGWVMGKNGVLEKDGKPLKFEFLSYSETFERWLNPWIANLKKLGVDANLRIVDAAQFQNRVQDFDFDMTITTFGQSLSPGNEQRDFWGSDKADIKGSRNMIGIKDQVVDDLIGKIVQAKDREELVALTRALDRVLLWGNYVIPNWYINYHRVASWDKFNRPVVTAKYGLGITDTWWYDPAKAAILAEKVKPADKK